jgi:UDP-N-acetylmuramoyl-tripeptide--D-alanyl-D-alanine ligase
VLVSLLTAREIARRAGGRVSGDEGATVDAFAFDSRVLADGACFVALRGARDGHDFVAAAFGAGARVALVDHSFAEMPPVGGGRALVFVDDTLDALQQVARSLRADRSDLHVVAVGGSTGKTSTKDLLAAALAPRGCYANAESYNNEFGLPITLCNTPASARVVVTEMGERFAGDLETLCAIALPDTGVVTNVGLAHAEHLGGLDGVIAVLSELLDALPARGTAVLNADDAATPVLAAATVASVVTVGTHADADYRIDAVATDDRLRPSFELGGRRFDIPLHGRHHAQNAAMAIAVAHRVFALPFDEIALELATATPGRWRMELLETDAGVTVLNDAYNANPTSMQAALVALAHLDIPPNARRIAVLGDMRELGAHHDDAHRDLGEQAAALGLDVLVGVGAGGEAIARAARAGVGTVHAVADAAEAVRLVAPMVRRGDAVLVKGSRALGLERVAESLVTAARHTAIDGARSGCERGDRP